MLYRVCQKYGNHLIVPIEYDYKPSQILRAKGLLYCKTKRIFIHCYLKWDFPKIRLQNLVPGFFSGCLIRYTV